MNHLILFVRRLLEPLVLSLLDLIGFQAGAVVDRRKEGTPLQAGGSARAIARMVTHQDLELLLWDRRVHVDSEDRLQIAFIQRTNDPPLILFLDRGHGVDSLDLVNAQRVVITYDLLLGLTYCLKVALGCGHLRLCPRLDVIAQSLVDIFVQVMTLRLYSGPGLDEFFLDFCVQDRIILKRVTLK